MFLFHTLMEIHIHITHTLAYTQLHHLKQGLISLKELD